MGNQSMLISVILFTAIFVLADNVDAHYACLDINRLVRSNEPTKPALNIIADNIDSLTGTNSQIYNITDYSKGKVPSYFNEACITTISFEKALDTNVSHMLALFSEDDNRLESTALGLDCRQMCNDKITSADFLVMSFKFADINLHRMQLTNLCIKPVPEPTAVSLVCLVLADWSSFTNVNKHIIRF